MRPVAGWWPPSELEPLGGTGRGQQVCASPPRLPSLAAGRWEHAGVWGLGWIRRQRGQEPAEGGELAIRGGSRCGAAGPAASLCPGSLWGRVTSVSAVCAP